jgi:mono/diheme cytochrome c family protein
MPRWVRYGLIILIPLMAVPFVLIARARSLPQRQPRIDIFQGMGAQPKLKPQAKNPLFADHRAMRMPVPGTVARGQLRADDHFEHGKVQVDGQWQWAEQYPDQVELTEQLLERGRERFNIFCAPCHGRSGHGQGTVPKAAEELGTPWNVTSVHAEGVRQQSLGELYNTVKWGKNTMPGYGSQIDTADRWAIVAYMRALQLSQAATVEDVPADRRDALR